MSQIGPIVDRILPSFICLACVAGASIIQASAADSPQPNFVLIYADDLGYADLGCYGNGYHETPHIDRLMRDGLRFTQAYADAPLCAPSRVALLTGRHSARAGCYDVFPRRILEGVGPDLVDFIPPENKWDLPAGCSILPEYLKQVGYRTGCFGKWHVGPAKPSTKGFDEFVSIRTISHLDVSRAFIARSRNYPPPEGYSSDYLTKCAEQFLDSQRDRPFFLYLPHTLVHTAKGSGAARLQPKPDLLRKYQSRDKTELHGNPAYAAMIEALDQAVGQTMEALRTRGLLDSTLVIFTSDNGGLLGRKRVTASGVVVGEITSNHPLRSGKLHLYEGGIRVPTSISYGDNVRRNAISDAVVSQLDLLPTILELAKHPQAKALAESLDGKSLVSLLSDAGADWPDRELFWHYPGYRISDPKTMTGQRPESAMRQGDWKMIESLETGNVQLYDLATDIGESNDVSAAHPEVVNGLRLRLHQWRVNTSAPMPERKDAVAGSRPNPDL